MSTNGIAHIDRAISRYLSRGELPNLDRPNLLRFYAGIAEARKAIRQAESVFWAETERELGGEFK